MDNIITTMERMPQLLTVRRHFMFRALTASIMRTGIKVCCLVITARPARRNAQPSLPFSSMMTAATRKTAATASNCPKTAELYQAVGCRSHKSANNSLRHFGPGIAQYRRHPMAKSAAMMGAFVEVEVGGATVFVINVEHFEQI